MARWVGLYYVPGRGAWGAAHDQEGYIMFIVSAFDDDKARPCFISFEVNGVGVIYELEAHVYDFDGVQYACKHFNFSLSVPSQIRRAIIIDRFAAVNSIIISESELKKLMP